jgi:hypothetical protein
MPLDALHELPSDGTALACLAADIGRHHLDADPAVPARMWPFRGLVPDGSVPLRHRSLALPKTQPGATGRWRRRSKSGAGGGSERRYPGCEGDDGGRQRGGRQRAGDNGDNGEGTTGDNGDTQLCLLSRQRVAAQCGHPAMPSRIRPARMYWFQGDDTEHAAGRPRLLGI